MNVSDRKCVRTLARQNLWASRTHDLITVLAIALTTVLFTSLFTIVLSINDGFQQNNFRQMGGYSHSGFKYLTEAQHEALKGNPLIGQAGLWRFVGMLTQDPFNKAHMEVSYADANGVHQMYCDPAEGRLSQEGTSKAATDTHVLELLGVEPELGARFTLTFDADGYETTQTFTLSGWWEYDEAIVANHVLLPESRADTLLDEAGVNPNTPEDGMTGAWNLDVMLKSGSAHIGRDTEQILAGHGFRSEGAAGEYYIRSGVNWGYTGIQLASGLGAQVVVAIVAVLLLILFTGYLTIYNVFQASVVNDVRFYGLLKTIGTTDHQLRRIIRYQALVLSLAGIPVGLLLGWLVRAGLIPAVIGRLNGVTNVVSVNSVLFATSALFALVTVFLSCRKPDRMAAKAPPVEAVRYTEGGKTRRKVGERAGKGVSPLSMAWASLGQNRGKTVVTVLSLCLAVVLLIMMVTFAKGFDMDKYIAAFTASDFILADAEHLQTGGEVFDPDMTLPESVVEEVEARDGITAGSHTYGCTPPVEEFVTEEYYRSVRGRWNDAETLGQMVSGMDRTKDGPLADRAQFYGMERFVLDRLTVLEGDISKLYEPGGRYVAAVYSGDDYGSPRMDNHQAHLGDKIMLRHVEEYEYYNPNTGEVYGGEEDIPEGAPFATRAVKYRDLKYKAVAPASVPTVLSYRYYGADEFILSDQTFFQDTGTGDIMYYTLDVDGGTTADMESFLRDYAENVNPQLDYENKAACTAEFEGFRGMFLTLGGALSSIAGLADMLNFFNAVFTGITIRRREFAVLQSIGMTGEQLKKILVLGDLLYTPAVVLASLLLTVVIGLLLGTAVNSLFWFFTYRFTLVPILPIFPIFAVLGLVTPLLTYHSIARHTVVERLREAE